MEKKSLISHICWVFVFLTMCYGFANLSAHMRDGFLVSRDLDYISMTMIAESVMYLLLGAMFGILLYIGVTKAVTKQQILIEILIVEIPILISIIDELGREILSQLGFQVRWVLEKPFYSFRLAAVAYIIFLFVVRKKVSCKNPNTM